MPASLARICPPLSFWNFSSAVALGPSVATARSANPVARNCLFIESPCTHRTNLGRLPALSRLLQHGLQGRSRSLISQLHIFSRKPYLIAASARFTSGLETKFVLLDPPLADALVTHGGDRERAVSLEDLSPMRFIRQLHPWKSCLNLRTGELLEFLLSCGVWFEGNDTECHDHRRSHLLLRLHRTGPHFGIGSSVRSSNGDLTPPIPMALVSSSRLPSCRAPRAVPSRASPHRRSPRSARRTAAAAHPTCGCGPPSPRCRSTVAR